jgi:O-antigen/teichoic acid export membrane protein
MRKARHFITITLFYNKHSVIDEGYLEMQLDIIKNAKRNIYTGFISKIVTLLVPFITRTILIKRLGIDYLGINSLFTSILQVLNLSELGFSSAIVYCMYKPIAEDDDTLICALLNFYKKVYKYVGLIIFVIGLVILPFVHFLIKGSYPADINIYVVFFIFLINTVVSYWFYGYKISLLKAHQREDIANNCYALKILFLNIFQIVVLLYIPNYYFYILLMPIFSLLHNFLIYFTVKKNYPQYICKGSLPPETLAILKKQVMGLFIFKIGNTTRNTFDSIFISAFLGLSLAGIYSNYYLVLTSISSIMSIISNSIVAGIGNKIITDSKEKNHILMLKINFVYMLIGGLTTIIMLCLYQPFMILWVGKSLVLDNKIMILFVIYYYLMLMGNIRGTFANAVGIWWENRYRSITEAIVNLILNYVLLHVFGLYGILLATNITLFACGFLWAGKILYKHYFKCSLKKYLLQNLKLLIINALIATFTVFICSLITYPAVLYEVIIKAVISTLVPSIIYVIFFRKQIKSILKIK